MPSELDKTVAASRRFMQPVLYAPRRVWQFAAIGLALLLALLLFTYYLKSELRYSLPVCVGLAVATIGTTAMVFLRFQHYTLTLLQRPGFVPRLVGVMFRTCLTLPPLLLVNWLGGNAAFLSAMPMLLMVTLFMLGLSIAGAGAVRRVGSEQLCAVCGYECRTSIERCSECGSHWLKPGGLIRGRRVVQRGPVVVGAIVVLIGFAGTISPTQNLVRWGLYLVPDDVRVRVATTGPNWSSEYRLKDLLTGALSPEDELLLATSLLEQRRENDGLSTTAVTWLEGKVLAGALTEAIRKRFFDGRLELWLEGPDTVKAGEPFHPLIASRGSGEPLGSALAMQIYLAGISTDGGRSFEGRNDFMLHGYTVSNVRYYLGHRFFQANSQFIPRASIDEPGEHEIVVRMWLALVPKAARSFTAQWNADGTPVLPQVAVWIKKLELRHTVSVERS